ncbi:MAG: RNase adapter RapZ [Candidatus Nanopelagicales bacterium]|nr:RNase adapter RapZ [Candidatus Nanopelagicales bacterium]MDP4715039.1 RNase adapter RapZ [Candidatus Nanopelagicales bacterium]MDP4906466.1 RNase adapter RapZ [Candidatus Nanopelagicales bacterium]MDP4975832.1 RNase adapter RapZ [Candidatus Nanopelagicales bacterium]MDP5095210.1 RNase adapter RapZ [Candidatus Nanopelagicales bacterium]
MSGVDEVVLVTGMSGAGRSTAARALEDQGWFVVDNLLPGLIPETVRALSDDSGVGRLAVVVDVRGGRFFDDTERALARLRSDDVDVRILFLEASDEALVRRFESNRRPHPLQQGERLVDGLRRERVALADLRAEADLVIDTGQLNVHDLRHKVEAAFGLEPAALRASVLSFGFKYGIPVDADVVLDARFLPNPHWVDHLRDLSGLDAPVHDFVVELPAARDFLDRATGLLDLMAEGYLREGKRYVTVAVGCTGGKHRSVALAEDLAARLVRQGVESLVVHRDLGRE